MTNRTKKTRPSWRCFYCDEVFTSRESAAMHFGSEIGSVPACTVDAERLRELERELASYRMEDTELHREICRLHSEIATRERRAEEDGYARGLADAKKHPAELGLQPI